MTSDEADRMEAKLIGKHPNTYTFTYDNPLSSLAADRFTLVFKSLISKRKFLGEHLLHDEVKDLPYSIIRPAVIGTWPTHSHLDPPA